MHSLYIGSSVLLQYAMYVQLKTYKIFTECPNQHCVMFCFLKYRVRFLEKIKFGKKLILNGIISLYQTLKKNIQF